MKYNLIHNIFILSILIIIIYLLYSNTNTLSKTFNNLFNTTKTTTFSKNNKPTALITGGARGIGKAYAIILLKNNYKVVIVDKLNAIKTANELKHEYGEQNVLGIHCDITDFNAYKNAFEEANSFSNDGIIDLLILNAAIIEPLFYDYEQIIKTNLSSPIYSTELYIQKITNNLSHKTNKPCQIVITGSLASFKPIDLALSPVYDATKSGISQFVRSLKTIATRYGFRINAICPVTMVNTGLIKPQVHTWWQKLGAQTYLNLEGRGGMMQPKDVAQALITVINDSSYNGDLIAVDTGNNFYSRLEPLDEYGAYKEYGKWSEDNSYLTKLAVDYTLNNILQNKQQHIWST